MYLFLNMNFTVGVHDDQKYQFAILRNKCFEFETSVVFILSDPNNLFINSTKSTWGLDEIIISNCVL